MIFIQKQILLLLALFSLSGEPILASAKTSSLFCSWGFAPWTPNRVPPLHPAGGPGGSQTPPLVGSLWPPVPATFSYSPATSNLDNPQKVFFFFFQATIYNEVSVI